MYHSLNIVTFYILFSTLYEPSYADSVLTQLPHLNIDEKRISISGLSSGADFAVQFQVAFSKQIMGLGVFAGQPYHCAVTRFPNDPMEPLNPDVPICEGCPENKTLIYDHCKSHPDFVDVRILVEKARQHAASGYIDRLDHLSSAKIYTYAGTKDPTIGATKKTRDFFAQFVPTANLLFNFTIPSGHCWPQNIGINTCGPWNRWMGNTWPAENCGYDGPGIMLEHIYGNLTPPARSIVRESLMWFDQTPFNGNNTLRIGLSKTGIVYVPRKCSGGALCSLHISLHGCSELFVFEDILMHTMSFNRWAETNNIVILWPHVGPHGGTNATKEEKQGCWDGYGQTGSTYDTRHSVQMQAIWNMVHTMSRGT